MGCLGFGGLGFGVSRQEVSRLISALKRGPNWGDDTYEPEKTSYLCCQVPRPSKQQPRPRGSEKLIPEGGSYKVTQGPKLRLLPIGP